MNDHRELDAAVLAECRSKFKYAPLVGGPLSATEVGVVKYWPHIWLTAPISDVPYTVRDVYPEPSAYKAYNSKIQKHNRNQVWKYSLHKLRLDLTAHPVMIYLHEDFDYTEILRELVRGYCDERECGQIYEHV